MPAQRRPDHDAAASAGHAGTASTASGGQADTAASGPPAAHGPAADGAPLDPPPHDQNHDHHHDHDHHEHDHDHDGAVGHDCGHGAAEAKEPAGSVLDRTKLLAARFRAAKLRPYLAAALYALSVVPSWHLATMGVDRHWRLYVNPDFVAEHDVEELAGVWVHEVAHLLRDHHGRADRLQTADRIDHHRVNLAQDCEINDDLVADGLTLPAARVEPKTFGLPEGRLFEEYLAGIPATPVVYVQCGSGAHGITVPGELGEGGAPEVRPVEADAIRRQTAAAIRSHVRSQGSVPDGWKRWADQIAEPVVDWRRLLTGALRQAVAWASGAVDYTYARPGRRSGALRGVVLPSLRRPLPQVAIVIDTSGSMGQDDLASALGEVTGVLRAVGIRGNRVTVLACDADVHAVTRVTKAEQVQLAGGGGTDMRVGITRARQGPQKPEIIVVLTDGFTPWPDEPMGCRLIAGLVGADPPAPPGWVEAIHITAT
ncbi:VWA-like domain-containing protein [Dactylosporangium sp. AC04546]|uniref:vWA domain-containing protein n=1 Tax=Dactylosporangium sp. AC04546 TaxID=2862460 RepID=UPI001EDF4A39|nr:VWA-like domain-containing protein [Dactylosporangium sp. AC04546]WVK81926.1 VWA-like domain-containing protein [Dactylosporangium sp. AC04546]